MVWAMVMVLRFVLVLVKSEYWTVFAFALIKAKNPHGWLRWL